MIAKSITMFGNPCILLCDAKCNKAWGINNRPRVYLQDPDLQVYPLEDGRHYPDNEAIDLDDYAYLSDNELGGAPTDPGVYEGGYAKPQSAAERLNKWCARECERSEIVDDGEEFEMRGFDTRRYNCAPHVRD